MFKNDEIDFVITEDSDLLLFGVTKAFYKFQLNGNGEFVDLDKVKQYKALQYDGGKKKKKDMDLCYFLKRYQDPKEFIHVCVLSGCDYLKNLKGIGLLTAVKNCTKNRRIDFLLRSLMADKTKKAPKDYRIQFKRAVLTFQHQTVYDRKTKKMTHLNPITDDVNVYLEELQKHLQRMERNRNDNNRKRFDENWKNPTVYDTTLNFLGEHLDDQLAQEIAEGFRDARSKKQRNLNRNRGNTGNNNNSFSPNNYENNNIEENGGNRFFASSQQRRSLQSQTNNVFKTNTNVINTNNRNITNNTNNIKQQKQKVRNTRKRQKYFGALENESIDNDDDLNSNLDDLFTQFGYQPNVNNHNSNNNNNNNENDEDVDNWSVFVFHFVFFMILSGDNIKLFDQKGRVRRIRVLYHYQ